MDTKSGESSTGLASPPVEPIPSSDVEHALRHLTEPTPAPAANLHGRAHINIRRHLARSAIRIVVLLTADLSTFWLARTGLRFARGSDLFGADARELVNRVFVHGYLGRAQYALALVLGLLVMGTYRAGDNRRDAQRIFLACTLATALALWSDVWAGSPLVTLGRFVMTATTFGGLLLSERLILDYFVARYYLRPASARTLLVGPEEECREMMCSGALGERTGFKLVGFVDTLTPPAPTARGHLGRLDAILHDDRIDTVVLCGHLTDWRFARAVRAAMAAECHVFTGSRSLGLSGLEPSVVWHRGVPLIELRAPVLRGQQMFLKRAMDIALSGLLLVALSPLFAAIALLVRLTSPGPVFFVQRRLGRHGECFRCLKFRSMYVDAEERLRGDPDLYELYLANDFKLPEELDARVTRGGRFLRRTSLDEMPQLYNVLCGSMSLVGPRPIVPDEIKHYDHEGPLFLSLKPGLTGAWQVNGRSRVAYPERAQLELEYVQSWSLAKDFEILLRTIPAVLFQRGAH